MALAWLQEVGLEPHHVVLDVGCGKVCLLDVIEYLDEGNYYGVDQQQEVIYGVGNIPKFFRSGNRSNCAHERVKKHGLFAKRPTFWLSEDFDFAPLGGRKADRIVCKEVWTHFTPDKICKCVKACRGVLAADGALYAVFDVSKERCIGPDDTLHVFPDYKRETSYPPKEVLGIVRSTGMECEYIPATANSLKRPMVKVTHPQ